MAAGVSHYIADCAGVVADAHSADCGLGDLLFLPAHSRTGSLAVGDRGVVLSADGIVRFMGGSVDSRCNVWAALVAGCS